MLTKTEIDPDISRFIDAVAEGWKKYPPFETLSLAEAREIIEKIRAPWAKGGPSMAQTTEQTIDTETGPLRIRIYRPEGAPTLSPGFVFLHGGGFTLFSLDTHDRVMREYAERGGFVVVGVDYPLSPEHKFPVALDRVTAFMLWLSEHAAEIGVDANKLAIGGDSAGGNISFATCLRLRDLDRMNIVKGVVPIYTGFTGRISDESEELFGGPNSILNREEAEQYWANYLPQPSDLDNPFACPLYAELQGLPPVYLVIAENDITTEDNIIMHQRLKDCGVIVEQKIYPGTPHSFLEAMSISSVARDAIDDSARFIQEQFKT